MILPRLPLLISFPDQIQLASFPDQEMLALFPDLEVLYIAGQGMLPVKECYSLIPRPSASLIPRPKATLTPCKDKECCA